MALRRACDCEQIGELDERVTLVSLLLSGTGASAGSAWQRTEESRMSGSVFGALIGAGLLSLSASASAAIQPGDFARPLQKADLRRSKPQLSQEAFDANFKAAQRSKMMFMRSYPGAMWADFSRLPKGRVPGKVGIAFGDAHPGNFGFIRLNGETRFVFNDLDDSGRGPVALDANRYFSILRLMVKDKELVRRVLDQYVATIKDPSKAVALDHSLSPDWKLVDEHDIEKVSDGHVFDTRKRPDLTRLAAGATRSEIESVVKSAKALSGYKVLDIASVARVYGGSGGLKRYLLLLERESGERRLWELKAAATPGINNEAGVNHQLSMGERLSVLKPAFWGSEVKRDFFYATVEGERYLMRDRTDMQSLDVTKLAGKAQENVLLAEVSYMASVHAASWEGVDKPEIRNWLWKSSKTVAKRWAALYKEGE
jgi:uncharacterized protein (DUF2252 family)